MGFLTLPICKLQLARNTPAPPHRVCWTVRRHRQRGWCWSRTPPALGPHSGEDRQRKAKQETAIQAVATTYTKPQPIDAQLPMGGLKIANSTPPKEGEGGGRREYHSSSLIQRPPDVIITFEAADRNCKKVDEFAAKGKQSQAPNQTSL